MKRGINSSANSGPSIGGSSIVTDSNSMLSRRPSYLQRSASINGDSYLHPPASPMSLSSNNISGSSAIDGGSIIQQNVQQDQLQKQGASSATSQMSMDPGNSLHLHKRSRLDTRQDGMLQPQLIQQLLQKQDASQFQRHQNPQMQLLIQQKLLQQRQQHQMLQSLPLMQRAHIQQQLRQQLQQQALQQSSYTKRPFDSGICARRLMQYMYHQRQRPSDNDINYWRKFVAEYFAPRAKKKWCLSSYDNVGSHALGVFPQAATDAWHCDICGSKSGKGFEATAEVLPRLSKIKFDSGITDELLFLDNPHESRLPSGIMLLEYTKAIQESIYSQLRVIREGQLRIIFTPDLKILSWEFCVRRHEEFLPRRLVAPQVNQLVQVSQKYQSTVTESGTSGVSPQDLQTNCNLFVTTGRQLARNMELQSLNDLGFSKRFIRCLQIAEVVNSMKDLISFSREHNRGPIESLKIFPRRLANKLGNSNTSEIEQLNPQILANDQNTSNKGSVVHPSPSNCMDKNQSVTSALNISPQNTMASDNYQTALRQNLNTNLTTVKSEKVDGLGQAQLLGAIPPSQVSLTNTSGSSLLTSQQPQFGNLLSANNSSSSQMNQHLQQHVIQQLLQGMMNNGKEASQQSISGSTLPDGVPKGNFSAGVGSSDVFPVQKSASSLGNRMEFSNGPSVPNRVTSFMPNGNNNFEYLPNNSDVIANNNTNLKQEIPQSLQMPDLAHDMSDFADSLIFNDDQDTWAIG